MSRKYERIDLVPPKVAGRPGKSIIETFVSGEQPCGYCHGDGEVMSPCLEHGEWGFAPCPLCGGTGRLVATVTIEWKARRIKS